MCLGPAEPFIKCSRVLGMRSLVLVGHGSHVNSRAARSVYRVAEELRQLGSFSEVIECFWKEEPSLRQALRVTGSTDVTVVPFFLSDGYFTDTVIPRELGLGHQGPVPPEGIARVLGGKTVRYLPPYGSFPGLSDVLVACAREALPEANAEDVALVLLGHPSARRGGTWNGTRRLSGRPGSSRKFRCCTWKITWRTHRGWTLFRPSRSWWCRFSATTPSVRRPLH